MVGPARSPVQYIIGYYSTVHWSSFISLRAALSGLAALFALTVTSSWPSVFQCPFCKFDGDGDALPSAPRTAIAGGRGVGINANIYRVASVYGCRELENYGAGTAGIVGNIIKTTSIAVRIMR